MKGVLTELVATVVGGQRKAFEATLQVMSGKPYFRVKGESDPLENNLCF